MANGKVLLLLAIGTAGALLLLARKAKAEPTNTIQIVSCLTPESIVVGNDIIVGAVLLAPTTNTIQVTKTMKADVNNCTKTKDITLNPGETRTETITFTYTECPLEVGDYVADINLI